MAWPDERLDDLGSRMDAGFERVDREIAALRTELKGDIDGLRTDMNERFERMYGLMFRLWVTLAVGLLGVVGALLGTGPAG